MQEEKSYDECLDNIKEKILILLSQHEVLEPEQISRFLRVGVEFSLFHLEGLEKSGMVMERNSSEGCASWKISQDGLGYLTHHGMLA